MQTCNLSETIITYDLKKVTDPLAGLSTRRGRHVRNWHFSDLPNDLTMSVHEANQTSRLRALKSVNDPERTSLSNRANLESDRMAEKTYGAYTVRRPKTRNRRLLRPGFAARFRCGED